MVKDREKGAGRADEHRGETEQPHRAGLRSMPWRGRTPARGTGERRLRPRPAWDRGAQGANSCV